MLKVFYSNPRLTLRVDLCDECKKELEEWLKGKKQHEYRVYADGRIEPEQKTSAWVAIDQEPHETWECGLCGFVIDGSGCIDPDAYRDIYKYCPNCGAKMEADE